MRLVCLGSADTLAEARRALERHPAIDLVGALAPAEGDPEALARLGGHDAVCLLDPLEPAPRTVALVHAHLASGTTTLCAGWPAEAAADLAELAGQPGPAALIVGGLLRGGPEGQALAGLAAGGRVGAPVYLRHAAESASPLGWAAADPIELALALLGPPRTVYAAALGQPPCHLALTLQHADGAVALLGVGVRRSGSHASFFLLGDRGVVEANPLAHAAVEPSADPAAEDWRAGLVGWLADADRQRRDEAARSAARARAGEVAAVLAAAERSLRSGQAEPIAAPSIATGGAR